MLEFIKWISESSLYVSINGTLLVNVAVSPCLEASFKISILDVSWIQLIIRKTLNIEH